MRISNNYQDIVARINIAALHHNFSIIRQLSGTSRVMAVIKANAYGHGIVPIAKALSDTDFLAVARINEALLLRQEGISKPIALFSEKLSHEKLELCHRFGLSPVIHSAEGIELVTSAPAEQMVNLWLKLDTGMHRLGLDPIQFSAAHQRLSKAPNVKQIGMMSHFATSDHADDSYTNRQAETFFACTENLTGQRSLANSAAILAKPNTHLDVVRPGIMLYGVDPLEVPTSVSRELKPVMSLEAPIIAIRRIGNGESVGYNRQWISKKPSTIATIGIGYADGYPRSAPSLTPVAIGGKEVPLVGQVSMDMICVDISGQPGIRVGDIAQLWGDRVSVSAVAKLSNTIPYELLTRTGKRVTYQYLNSAG